MGADLFMFNPHIKEVWQKCWANKTYNDDCQYTDSDGVVYTYYFNDGKPAKYTAFEARLSSRPYRLIAGLKFGDSISTVRKKIAALPKNFPTWTEYNENGPPRLFSSYCFRSKEGMEWQYRLIFDAHDRLTSIEEIGNLETGSEEGDAD